MPSTSSFEFNFQASGVGVSGQIDHPFSEAVPVLAAAVLPPTGGVASAQSESFGYHDLIFIGSVATQLTGHMVAGVGWGTTVLVTLEDCHVPNEVSADRISLRLTSMQPADGRRPSFSLVGTTIENLRVRDKLVEVRFDPEIMTQSLMFERIAGRDNVDTFGKGRLVSRS